jgi:hypothetical protein
MCDSFSPVTRAITFWKSLPDKSVKVTLSVGPMLNSPKLWKRFAPLGSPSRESMK